MPRAAATRQQTDTGGPEAWTTIRDELRSRGLRWTPQRRLILDALRESHGHITGAELVERCRSRDPDTTPSTVYRTLDVLEDLGYLRHSHSAAGREEFHVLPDAEHAHLQCRNCGRTVEMTATDARSFVQPLIRQYGFRADVGHLTLSGLCRDCAGGPKATS